MSWSEWLHAQIAINIATFCGLFECDDKMWEVKDEPIRHASIDDITHLQQWKEELRRRTTADQVTDSHEPSALLQTFNYPPTVEPLLPETDKSTCSGLLKNNECLSAARPMDLNLEQACESSVLFLRAHLMPTPVCSDVRLI